MPAITADLAQVLLHFLTVWDSAVHHSKVHLTRCFILIGSSHHIRSGATEGEWSITTVARQESGKARPSPAANYKGTHAVLITTIWNIPHLTLSSFKGLTLFLYQHVERASRGALLRQLSDHVRAIERSARTIDVYSFITVHSPRSTAPHETPPTP